MEHEKRFSLRISDELLERVRRVAAQEERSLNVLMVRALRAYVEQAESEQATKGQ